MVRSGRILLASALFIGDIPKSVPTTETFEVRGEIFCTEADFIHLSSAMRELKLDAPTSQRNIVAGLLGRKENIQLSHHLSFRAFDLISDEKFSFEHQKLEKLKALGFETPEYEIHKTEGDLDKRINQSPELYGKWRLSY